MTQAMSSYLHKSHNVAVLLYHLVCPAKARPKARRVVFDAALALKAVALKAACLELARSLPGACQTL